MIVRIEEKDRKETIAKAILAELQDWFGIPESTAEYVKNSRELPFWAAVGEQEAGREAGFLVLKETSPDTAEIYVMGVLPKYHRSGIGRQLAAAGIAYAGEQGYTFLQVKTVQEGHYEEYDRTNRFYKSIGFKELECFPTLWDEWNPCQVLVMSLPPSGV